MDDSECRRTLAKLGFVLISNAKSIYDAQAIIRLGFETARISYTKESNVFCMFDTEEEGFLIYGFVVRCNKEFYILLLQSIDQAASIIEQLEQIGFQALTYPQIRH